MPRHALLLPVGLVFACYDPDLSKVRIITDDLAPPTDAAADAAADAGTAGPDLQPVGCRNGAGIAIGTARGCMGAFPKGQAAMLCSPNWSICRFSTQVDTAACAAAPAFFAADVPAFWGGVMSSEVCGTAVGNQLLYGCGAAGRAGYAKCEGFLKVIDLGTSWASPNGTLAQASNTDATQGVLCCPP